MSGAYGRGAWTTIGGADPYYELASPNMGSQAVKDPTLDSDSFDFRAVNYGVKAIQQRINEMGCAPVLVVDGWFGSATSAGVRWAQERLDLLVGHTSGRVGQSLSKALFRPVVLDAEKKYGISGHHLGGIMMHESGADPGAVGYSTHWDKGLFQWNCDPATNPAYTVSQAFDYHWSTETAAKRLAAAQVRYGTKGTYLQVHCSIAQHNSPAWSEKWFVNEFPPNQAIDTYVSNVLNLAQSF